MALTKAILDTTPHSITYSLTEDGTAVGELAVNVIADCAAGALKTLLQTAVADAAEAEALIEDNVMVTVRKRSGTAAKTTNLAISFDDAATVIEMNCLAIKATDTDVSVWIVTLKLNHSLTA